MTTKPEAQPVAENAYSQHCIAVEMPSIERHPKLEDVAEYQAHLAALLLKGKEMEFVQLEGDST